MGRRRRPRRVRRCFCHSIRTGQARGGLKPRVNGREHGVGNIRTVSDPRTFSDHLGFFFGHRDERSVADFSGPGGPCGPVWSYGLRAPPLFSFRSLTHVSFLAHASHTGLSSRNDPPRPTNPPPPPAQIAILGSKARPGRPPKGSFVVRAPAQRTPSGFRTSFQPCKWHPDGKGYHLNICCDPGRGGGRRRDPLPGK